MNNEDFTKEKIDRLFSNTWFGLSLSANSGIKLWKNGSIAILKQPDYKLTQPINWLDDPYDHRSWRWMLNSFHWMDRLLASFKFDYNCASIKKCVTYFLDWANFYIVKNQDGEFLWKDDAVSHRTYRLSIISYYIFNSDIYTDEERKLTKRVLQRHYLELSDPKKFRRNNHGIFQIRALINLMTLHPDLGDFSEAKKYAIKRLDFLWLKQYGHQNMHLENSTGYHQYIIEEFDQILDSPEFSGLKFIFNKQKIQEVKENTKYYFHPNGIGTLFGDSNLTKQKHQVSLGDHIFNEAGYTILSGQIESKDNSFLAVRTGFPSNAHRHSDDFSFEWSEKGQIIFQDSGRYSYDYDNPYRIFVSSTKAHNTVTVNDANFPWWGSFEPKDFYTGAVQSYHGTQEKAELTLSKEFNDIGVQFSRTLDIERGSSLRIVDVLTSSTENTYEQWFHLADDFEYIGVKDNGRLVFQTDKLRLEVIVPKNTEVVMAKGQKQPFLQGWVSYSEKAITPRWSLGFKAKAKSFRFHTKFLVY